MIFEWHFTPKSLDPHSFNAKQMRPSQLKDMHGSYIFQHFFIIMSLRSV